MLMSEWLSGRYVSADIVLQDFGRRSIPEVLLPGPAGLRPPDWQRLWASWPFHGDSGSSAAETFAFADADHDGVVSVGHCMGGVALGDVCRRPIGDSLRGRRSFGQGGVAYATTRSQRGRKSTRDLVLQPPLLQGSWSFFEPVAACLPCKRGA